MFRDTLEESIKKNGEKTLTNRYLLNIVKLVDKKIQSNEDRGIVSENQCEIDECGDR